MITIPVINSRIDTTSPAISAGLLCNRTFSHRMPRAMEMTGSAEVMIAWTGARNASCWEGVLVEHEASRADDGKNVDGPVAEHCTKPAAKF